MAALAPARDLRRVGYGEIEPAQIDEQPEAFDVGRRVIAVPILPARRSRQGTRAFIEAEGVRSHPQLVGKLSMRMPYLPPARDGRQGCQTTVETLAVGGRRSANPAARS